MVDAKTRAQMLKRLREQHHDTVEATQAYLRALQAIRKKINTALQGKPLTVPELALATEIAPDQALWHIAALRKYGLVVEVDQDDGYYRYALAEETN